MEQIPILIYKYAYDFTGHEVFNDQTNHQFQLNGNIIRHQSTPNVSWAFNQTLTAQTISISEETILGQLDSLKSILLSNNDTIYFIKKTWLNSLP